MMRALLENAVALWLAIAVVLGIAELAVPGVFLIFLAVAAAITGVSLLALPGLPVAVQLVSFGVWSVVAVLIGRRWYRDYPVGGGDPLLNDRAARMKGAVVTVTEALAHGHGRVRIGDGEWPATGPDAAPGTDMRVVAVRDGVVAVEPLSLPPSA
jgi:membrane protein implicated in regulation of membrane protease activity